MSGMYKSGCFDMSDEASRATSGPFKMFKRWHRDCCLDPNKGAVTAAKARLAKASSTLSPEIKRFRTSL